MATATKKTAKSKKQLSFKNAKSSFATGKDSRVKKKLTPSKAKTRRINTNPAAAISKIKKVRAKSFSTKTATFRNTKTATTRSTTTATAQTQRYILLPANHIQAGEDTNPEVTSFLLDLNQNVSKAGALKLSLRPDTSNKNPGSVSVNVLDSIHENGAKLVSIKNDEMADFRFSYPGLRIIPEKFYKRAFRHEVVNTQIRQAKSAKTVTAPKTIITILDENKKPLAGIYLVGFTDFASRTGASGTTNLKGQVNLSFSSKRIERLYVYPDDSYWGYFEKDFTLKANMNISLSPIKLDFVDSLRHFYPTSTWPPIAGSVRVGIIDTGFGPHKNVTIKAGRNMVLNEIPTDYQDHEGHGTHVAGIIAANGNLAGVANGAELYIYRVFPENKDASNYDIMKAIDQAKQDQCDLINMSLGESGLDEGIVSSIKDAYDAGIICVVANGNDDRGPVSFPASYSLCLAISAMGRKGCFPPKTVQTGIVSAPYGTDKLNFIADFSNIGPETDLTAPGVGIISTFPNYKYAVMDGTSMACPAATGMAARLLSTRPDLIALPRNQVRADEIQKFLSTKVKSMGFGSNFEGKGMLFP